MRSAIAASRAAFGAISVRRTRRPGLGCSLHVLFGELGDEDSAAAELAVARRGFAGVGAAPGVQQIDKLQGRARPAASQSARLRY